MTRYIFLRSFIGSRDTFYLKMSKIKAVASGHFVLFDFYIYWTLMRSIFWPQISKICLKLAFGALEYAWKKSAIWNQNCGFFSVTPKIKVIFWPKFKMTISAVLPTRNQKALNIKLLYLRGSYGKNLVWKLRPIWAAV